MNTSIFPQNDTAIILHKHQVSDLFAKVWKLF